MYTDEKRREYLRKYRSLPSYKSRTKEYSRKYYLKSGYLITRRYRLAKKYGITEKEYDVLLLEHKGVCACCGGTNQDGASLCVDHDHETGKVRGLLCKGCNTAIGGAKDSIPTLFNMIGYLLERG